MSYRVIFNHPALKRDFEKVLRKVPLNLKSKIITRVMALAENPRPQGITKIKPPLDIHNSLAQYRIRVEDFRVLYDINDQAKTVSIIALRRRNEVTYE